MTLASRAADHMKEKPKLRVISDEDSRLASYVKGKYDLGMELRRPFEQRWLISLAFITGKQYTFFNRSSHSLQQLKRIRGRIRNVDNKLLPKWRRQIADLVKSEPIMSVVPATNEDEDLKAAKIADKVLKAFWRNAKMKRKVRHLAGWIYSVGNGFLDHRWDPRKGPISLGEEGKVEYAGDVDCGVWSPFEILVPFTAMGEDDLHGFPWMEKVKRRGLDWISARYKKGKHVSAENERYPTVDMGLMMGGAGGAASKVEGAVVIDHYEQPNYQHKNGLFVTVSNGILLQKDDFPFDRYNLEHFKDIDVPGIFWGDSTTSHAVGLQRTWNSTTSSINEFNRTLGKGKLLVPRGSKLEVDPDDTHGQMLYYKPVLGHKPELLDLKNLPSTFTDALAITQTSIEDLYSQHEVSRGTNKSDIRSGDMVSLLREQDAHGNIPAHAVFEESLEELMGSVLKRVKKGYENERMLQVVGKDKEWEVFAFKGADLRNNTDVMVKKQSSLPDSRVARERIILEKFEKGFYGDPRDPEVRRHVANMIDDAIVDDLYADTRLDEAVARWENKLLAAGEPIPLNNYDNHGLHEVEHNHYRKTMEHQKMKTESPEKFTEAEAAFVAHSSGHQEFIEEQRKRMLEEQALAEGKGRG